MSGSTPASRSGSPWPRSAWRAPACPSTSMPGNDDDFEIDPVLARSTYLQDVNERVVELTPWHQLVSMGWSSPTPWSTPRELPEEEFLDRLSGLMSGVRDPRKTVMMTHVPPHDSGLDTAPAPVARPAARRPAPETSSAGPSARPGSARRSSGSSRSWAPTATSTNRVASGGSATPSASTPDPSRRWASCAATSIDLSANGVERTLRVEG